MRKITVEDLHDLVRQQPAELRCDDGGRTLALALDVLRHFFGPDWVRQHLHHDAKRPGFLSLDFSSDWRRALTVFRAIDFAECLINLQHTEGFHACIDEMRASDDKIEATHAELDFARLLHLHDVDFRFVAPAKKRKGEDFDFEVTLPDGRIVAADAKCKLESTAIDVRSVENSLRKARKQLPSDRAGMIFVRTPQAWIEDHQTANALVDVGTNFLTRTSRIVSIKFYVWHLQQAGDQLRHRFAYREITNHSSRFDDGRSWDLFSDRPGRPTHWNGMPAHWLRLFFFPASSPP